MEHEVYCEISEKLSDKCTCMPELAEALETIVTLSYGSYRDAIGYAEDVLAMLAARTPEAMGKVK